MSATLTATVSVVARERFLRVVTVLGFLVPNAMLIAFLARHGFDLHRYFTQWIQLLPSAQLTADLGICCVAFLGWAAWDGPRSGVRRWWVAFPATALVGLCFGLPLYLLLRERATRCAGLANRPHANGPLTDGVVGGLVNG